MSGGAVLVYKIHRASTYVTIIFCAFWKDFFFSLTEHSYEIFHLTFNPSCWNINHNHKLTPMNHLLQNLEKDAVSVEELKTGWQLWDVFRAMTLSAKIMQKLMWNVTPVHILQLMNHPRTFLWFLCIISFISENKSYTSTLVYKVHHVSSCVKKKGTSS